MNLMFRVLFLIWFSFHPVHVTLTSIDYVPETDDFKGFVRLHLDDFLLDCRLHGYVVDQKKFLTKDTGSIAVLEKYLNEKLIIKVNNEAVKGSIGKVEISDNEINVNILFAYDSPPETLVVKSLIMTDLYSDQSNMIIVRVDDYEKGVKLTPHLTEQAFIIK